MSVSLLFPAYNRLEFTKQAWAALMANTDWSLVSEFHVYDDGSTDGTREWLRPDGEAWRYGDPLGGTGLVVQHHDTAFRSPMGITLDWIRRSHAPFLAKLDNDTIYPPGWLNIALGVINRYPELGMLGLECMRPPAILQTEAGHREDMRCLGTTGATLERLNELGCGDLAPGLIWPEGLPFRWIGPMCTPWVTGDKIHWEPTKADFGYIEAQYVSGLFLARREVFASGLPDDNGYFGLEEFQVQRRIKAGWILPSLPVFLLDRLPMEPWKSLSESYVKAGWQRQWSGAGPLRYKPEQHEMWDWWKPV